MQFAGFWIRVVAYLIDFVILLIGQFVILSIFGVSALSTGTAGFSANASSDSPLLNLILIVLGAAYFVGFESSKQQGTPGKRAMGLIVTDAQGNRVSIPRAIGRYFAKFLSSMILFIGFIMVAFTDKKQGLHDMICGTLVIKANPGEGSVDPSVFE